MDQERRSADLSRFILYSDFNCPFCYALHERLYELKLIEQVDWHGVQHAPYLPIPMSTWQGTMKAELQHEVAVVQQLAPELPIALPAGKPNTRPAIDAAIHIFQQDHDRGLEFVREVYRAFWLEGRDISDAAVLAKLAGDVKAIGSVNTRIAEEWEVAWHETGQAGVPLIVSPDGEFLVGCVLEDSLRQFFALLGSG